MNYLVRLRSDSSFDEFYKSVLETSHELTPPQTLPRYRRIPRRIEEGNAENYTFITPQVYFRRQYFEVLDLMSTQLKDRFNKNVECLLLW